MENCRIHKLTALRTSGNFNPASRSVSRVWVRIRTHQNTPSHKKSPSVLPSPSDSLHFCLSQTLGLGNFQPWGGRRAVQTADSDSASCTSGSSPHPTARDLPTLYTYLSVVLLSDTAYLICRGSLGAYIINTERVRHVSHTPKHALYWQVL